jgi:hypothetical protein
LPKGLAGSLAVQIQLDNWCAYGIMLE